MEFSSYKSVSKHLQFIMNKDAFTKKQIQEMMK